MLPILVLIIKPSGFVGVAAALPFIRFTLGVDTAVRFPIDGQRPSSQPLVGVAIGVLFLVKEGVLDKLMRGLWLSLLIHSVSGFGGRLRDIERVKDVVIKFL